MKHSESLSKIAAALVAAQAEFPVIAKTKEVIVNTQKGAYTFKYAPLEDTLALLRPVMSKHGLCVTQGAEGESIVTTVMHSSGEWISHTMPLLDTANPQQYGAQFTYRRRYSLKAALGIETDDDDSDRSFTDDGKPKKATPTAGAMDGVPKERHELVNRMAGTIIDCFSAGKPEEAYRAYSEIQSMEEKVAVWTFLDSKMRRKIKEIGVANGKGS